jgi:hypothetical protein
MDTIERLSSPPRPEAPPRAAVILSVNRGLWGEVSAALRSVRVACDGNEIHLYCYFAGEVSEDDTESMQCAASSVAADFPGYLVFEHCIASDPARSLPGDDGSAIVFERKERFG